MASMRAIAAVTASTTASKTLRHQRHSVSRGAASRGSVSTAATSQVTLFGSQGSRSPLVNWYANEIGLELTMKAPSDGANPHPFKQVPALRDGDLELWESGAILSYLADQYGGLDTPEARAECAKWVYFANATLDPVVFKENANGGVVDTGARDPNNRRLGQLERVLEGREFLVGDTFSVADVAVCAYLLYVPQFFPDVSFAPWPNLVKYMGRCASRDAYGKAFGQKVQQYLVQKCIGWVKASGA
jgi:glutathione S-transferase|mmetsp:Transcript_5425/g.19772  ORF Transcript_5425/g.19772 Transcript_5425/m.19772 type:complete len:245 (-) Transcript_5425:146-880(-)